MPDWLIALITFSVACYILDLTVKEIDQRAQTRLRILQYELNSLRAAIASIEGKVSALHYKLSRDDSPVTDLNYIGYLIEKESEEGKNTD